jgi:hypothetical protein
MSSQNKYSTLLKGLALFLVLPLKVLWQLCSGNNMKPSFGIDLQENILAIFSDT